MSLRLVSLIFAPVVGALVFAGLFTALVVDPPALGWVGFGIVCVLIFGLAVLASILVPRGRVAPQEPAVAADPEHRLLVVADPDCDVRALSEAIYDRSEHAVAVHVVVPVRVSRLHFLANDESEERRDAEQTMQIVVGLLRERGIGATGSVGSDKPLESMTDELGAFPASQVLLLTPPAEQSYWLERDLLAKARALTDRPVVHAIVRSALPVRVDEPQVHGRDVRR